MVDRQAIRKLAKEWGCTVQTLYKRLRALGIKTRKGGDATIGTQAKENNPNWKGGRPLDASGYVVINYGGSQIREHRVVAEKMLNRKLNKDEVVHHINGIKNDNRPENLMVMTQSEHLKHHRKLAALAAIEE